MCMFAFSHVHPGSQPKILSAVIIWFGLFLSREWKNCEPNAMLMLLLHYWMPEHTSKESLAQHTCSFGMFQSRLHNGGPTLLEIALAMPNGGCCHLVGLRGSNFESKFRVEMCTENPVFGCITILVSLLSVVVMN